MVVKHLKKLLPF
nr:hypothetical protein [Tanacetum cinerariifolium]